MNRNLLLAILILDAVWVVPLGTAHASPVATSVPGVKPGDNASYVFGFSWHTDNATAFPTPQNFNMTNISYAVLRIATVSGANVTFSLTFYFLNGTSVIAETENLDVQTQDFCYTSNSFTGTHCDVEGDQSPILLLAAGLQAPDAMGENPSVTLNQTATRTILGAQRTVNMMNLTQFNQCVGVQGSSVCATRTAITGSAWDHTSGIMVEAEGSETLTSPEGSATGSLSFVMASTNLWTSSPPGSWTQLSPSTSAPARFDASLAYDGADGYVLLFGGFNRTSFSDTWKFQAGTWTQLSPSTSPSPRSGATMVYDAADGYILLFGGSDGSSALGDTWKFAAGVWSQVSTAPSPPGRFEASMVYDAADGYALLFGGSATTSFSGVPVLGDTWEFKAGTWTQLAPAPSPIARSGSSIAYDAADGYVLLFGGFNNTSLGDTWKFSGGTWTQLSPSTSPPARLLASMTNNAADGSMLLFGGGSADTWHFAAGSWSQITSTTSPSARYRAPITYDAGDGYVLLFGGQDSNSQLPLGDTWNFGLTLVPDFKITSSPSNVTIKGGGSGSAIITLTSVNGFAGTVSLQESTSSPQLSCSLSVMSVTLSSSGNSSLTISCSGSQGTYTVTVTGITGNLSHSITLTFTVLHGRRGHHF